MNTCWTGWNVARTVALWRAVLSACVSVIVVVTGCNRSTESIHLAATPRVERPQEACAVWRERNGAGLSWGRITAIPRWNQWSLLTPDLRRTLRARVAGATRAEWHRLVLDGDGDARGLGIFLADQHGDVAALLSWCDLLEDHRKTLPYPLPVATTGFMPVHRQTVSGYLSAVYQEWFGVDVDGDRARCESYLGAVANPARPVRPWVVRLLRARGAGEVRRLKREVSGLSEPERAVVVALAFEHDLMDREDACRAWSGISPGLRDDLEAAVPVLPDEPMVRAYGGRFLSRVADIAGRLAACLEEP